VIAVVRTAIAVRAVRRRTDLLQSCRRDCGPSSVRRHTGLRIVADPDHFRDDPEHERVMALRGTVSDR
jgi:hypothetical protein